MKDHLTDNALIAAIDAAAETGASVSLTGHLQSCAACRQRLAEFEATLAFTRQLPDPGSGEAAAVAFTETARRRLWSPKHAPAWRPARTAWRPARTAWRPAMAGALVTGALAASLAFFFLPSDVIQSPTPATSGVTTQAPAAAADPIAHVDADDGVDTDDEQELATMLDTYLFETASTDELLLELDGLSDDDYYALLED